MRIHHRQVDKETLCNDENAKAEGRQSDERDDLMNLRIRTPSENEEADGHHEGSEEGGYESSLGRAHFPGFGEGGIEDPVEVCPE